MKDADLVLEGGLVSGLVHPAAVLELSQDYRFRHVGGASSGAYVAAATAAAEMARDRGGFDRLARFSAELARPGLVEKLFQAPPETAPLLRTLLAAMRAAGELPATAPVARAYRVLRTLVESTPGDLATGAILGLFAFGLLVVLVNGAPGWWAWLPAAVFATAGGLTAVLRRAGALVLGLRHTGFGIVSGLGQPGSQGEALTEWLTRWLDEIADVPGPLTLGQLETAGVSFHTITTNLSEVRPYAVPFYDHRFLFSEREMRELFPPPVVNHLVENAYRSDRVDPPEGYHFLPDWKELPVIVAVRLSNSFPILLRTIPLYSIDVTTQAPPGEHLRPRPGQLCRNLFSDGGICSNFPIHFFDRWLPTYPTFGISIGAAPARRFHNLVRVQAEAAAVSSPVGVHLPPADRPEPATWQGIDSVGAFLAAALVAAKDSRDTLQRELPGYRERVVQVRLPPGTSGLGPAMHPSVVQDLMAFGTQAGRALRGFNFAQHRWVRLRSLIPRVAEEAKRVREQLDRHFTVTQVEQEAVQSTNGGPPIFPAPPGWSDRAQAILETLGAVGSLPLCEQRDPCEPRPLATLRLTPQFGTAHPPPPMDEKPSVHPEPAPTTPDSARHESPA